jgi:PTH1 family peptidyl-tRNA hydrolase
MKLIIGLGNPGKKYEKTRHNVGFMVVEQFLKDFEPVTRTVWEDNKKCKSDIARIEWQPKHGEPTSLLLVKPKTYMNNSGMAVSLLKEFYKVEANDIWIVYDEADLPIGSMKIRFGGASAGHHGVESIIESLGTDQFWRFRMGIGLEHQQQRPQRKIDDYVLGGFTGPEKGKVKDLIKHGAKAIALSLEESLEAAQNRFNTK